ncbi:TetR/AcrR family transcriptional regulator [Alistipes sp. An66]|uniref:TetR/AcrR family transcriptional regulator n=1 Tax=Alistipes sp. An66 TaxID=1965650 RepID=UPI000B39FA41|nr:TetR/AcrR family transcriptional regulator [Alistipes sp. An66]OUN58284.1 TetR family transcriptional regulator [Alistipes sp. An66]HIY14061.1 TetR/AcrR family transcriptional regulator [Candidatus Alistipes cottocaccae]
MKRGATREEIIRTTQEFIARNGIRAVRVDEIAQTLGISKRTLYEMFTDKNDLISACLDAMSRQQQEQIVACRKRRSGNPLQKTVRLMNEYIENLYRVDHSFLSDLRRKVIFAEHYDEHRGFWHKELTMLLDMCRKQELLLPEIDAAAFAEQLMGTLLDLRLNGTSREELSLFGRTILRGAATRQGIELIDRRP